MQPRRFIAVIAVLSLSVSALFALTAHTVTSTANLPAYYSNANAKSGANLWSALHTIAGTGYSGISYSDLWDAYCQIDINSSGYVWDMYSSVTTYTCGTAGQCGNYSAEKSCYNREHSIPKSWFGGTTSTGTPGTDLFHVVPTDGWVNNKRSSYAFGEVSSATYTSMSGCKLGTPKSITITNSLLGTTKTVSTTQSTVFEPQDEYKGDFARGYFGTLIKWAGSYTFNTSEGAAMFGTTYTAAGYFGLTQYGLALLLKWHRQDPVSQKEIDRNNGIQKYQGNRNPFIDYPCLVEYIWGEHAGETVTISNLVGSFSSSFSAGSSDGCSSSSSSCTTPTLSATNKSVTVGSTVASSVTTNSSGAKTYTSSNTSVATVNSSGTITGVAAGTATITVNVAASGSYCAASTTFTVTVTASTTKYTSNFYAYSGSSYTNVDTKSATAGTAFTVGDQSSPCSDWTFAGWTNAKITSNTNTTAPTFYTSTLASNTDFYAVFTKTTGGSGSGTDNLTCSEGTLSGTDMTFSTTNFTVKHSKGTGSAFASYSPWRVYTGNTVAISGSKIITSISIVHSGTNYGTLESSAGSVVMASTTGGTTTISGINSKSVTITNSGSQSRWTSIAITYSGGGTTYYTTQPSCAVSTYTITVNSATGGSATASATSAAAGTTITITATPSTGYDFAGWTVSGATPASSSATSTTFTMPSANVTVTPSFTKKTYTISYNKGANGTGTNTTATKTYGTALTLSGAIFTRTGYTQTGWATSDGGPQAYALSGSYTANAAATLYPVWTASSYTITYKDQNNTTFTGTHAASYPTTHTYGTATSLDSPTRTGYTFGGYYTTSACTGTAITSLSATGYTANITLYAKWTAATYTVTLNTNNGTINAGNVTSYTYGVGATLPTNVTRSGYTFGGWYESSTFSGSAVTTISTTATGNKTYYAKWTAAATYTITLNTNGGTINAGNVTSYIYGVGATLPTNVTRTGYTFGGWYESSTFSGSAVTTISTTATGNKTYYAKWTLTPTYTASFYNNGALLSTQTLEAGQSLSAPADPAACEGYTFEGWSTSQYTVSNTATPSLTTFPLSMPASAQTYYAVYSKTASGGTSSSSVTLTMSSFAAASGTDSESGISFSTAKNSGTTSPTYNATGLDVRLYAKGTITITAPSTMSAISFQISTQGAKRLAPITASTGTMTVAANTTCTWAGSATTVTFTVGDKADYGTDGNTKAGQLDFSAFTVTLSGTASTTYHTTAPDCTCLYVVTVAPDDPLHGTTEVVEE